MNSIQWFGLIMSVLATTLSILLLRYINRRKPGERRVAKTLPEGVWRIVNVDAPTLRDNIENGTKKPMVRVRDQNDLDNWEEFSGVRINGTCELFPTFDKPLPGTNGRGICYISTEAEIECFKD